MEEFDVKKANEAWREKVKYPKCPMCSNDPMCTKIDFSIAEDFVVHIHPNQSGFGDNMGYDIKGIKSIAMVCDCCGYIAFHSIRKLGIKPTTPTTH